MKDKAGFRSGRISLDSNRHYLASIERRAYAHLSLLSCCPTLLDAIRHVTRSWYSWRKVEEL